MKSYGLTDKGAVRKNNQDCFILEKCETGRCLQCDLRLQLAPQKFWNDYVAVGEGGEQ